MRFDICPIHGTNLLVRSEEVQVFSSTGIEGLDISFKVLLVTQRCILGVNYQTCNFENKYIVDITPRLIAGGIFDDTKKEDKLNRDRAFTTIPPMSNAYKPETPTATPVMKISELHIGMKDLTIKGEVVEVGQVQTAQLGAGKATQRFVDLIVRDETGSVPLRVWSPKTTFAVGSLVQAEHAYTGFLSDEFGDELGVSSTSTYVSILEDRMVVAYN